MHLCLSLSLSISMYLSLSLYIYIHIMFVMIRRCSGPGGRLLRAPAPRPLAVVASCWL